MNDNLESRSFVNHGVKHLDDVHYCDWASQPDIHLLCNDEWTTAAWEQEKSAEGVYNAERAYLYTFEKKLVTCWKCRQGMNRTKKPTHAARDRRVRLRKESKAVLRARRRS